MSTTAHVQILIIVAETWFIVQEALQMSLLAGVLAIRLILLTLLVWMLAYAINSRD